MGKKCRNTQLGISLTSKDRGSATPNMLMQSSHDNMFYSNSLCSTTSSFWGLCAFKFCSLEWGAFLVPGFFLQTHAENQNISGQKKKIFWKGKKNKNFGNKKKRCYVLNQKVRSFVMLLPYRSEGELHLRSWVQWVWQMRFDYQLSVSYIRAQHTHTHSCRELAVLCSRQFPSGANMKINELLSPETSVPQWGKTTGAQTGYSDTTLLHCSIEPAACIIYVFTYISNPGVKCGHNTNQGITRAGVRQGRKPQKS